MPKAEVGSTKYIANKMKAKGLQRLRWYCQVCGKQTRDENGFKQHTLSEGHVRQMMLVGEDPKKYINNYSNQFKRDFLQLLRTSHGEKKVYINHFYQEYIRDKEHVHMNATRWPSLTEFAKFLGREGICRVDEGERGLQIQWIDDSPEAIKRKEDIKRKDRQAKGDEQLESRMLAQQIRKAREAERSSRPSQTEHEAENMNTDVVKADEPAQPIHLSLKKDTSEPIQLSLKKDTSEPTLEQPAEPIQISIANDSSSAEAPTVSLTTFAPETAPSPAPVKLFNPFSKPKTNGLLKKNPLAKKADASSAASSAPEKKMSNTERIMREELERKRLSDERGFSFNKRQRMS